MSKLYVQNFPEVLKYSGSLAAGASVSGSIPAAGYSQLVGYIKSSGSSETGSGLYIKQSVDGGTNWDVNSGCLASATAFTSSCMIDTIGNAFMVRYCNGATTAACVRMLFQLKPIAGTAKMPDMDIDVISSGSVTITSGSLITTAGSITAASVDVVKSGSLVVTSGSIILNAGESRIGVVGGEIRRISASFVRPNNATNYDAKDSVSDATTGGTPTGLIFSNVGRTNGGTGWITKAMLFTSSSAFVARHNLHIYNASPPAILDGSPFTLSFTQAACKVGTLVFSAMTTEGTGSSAARSMLVPGAGNLPLSFTCATASNSLYGLLEILDACTPEANASYMCFLEAEVN